MGGAGWVGVEGGIRVRECLLEKPAGLHEKGQADEAEGLLYL